MIYGRMGESAGRFSRCDAQGPRCEAREEQIESEPGRAESHDRHNPKTQKYHPLKMTDNKENQSTDDAGMDLGELMMSMTEKKKFECWKDIKVFRVTRMGIFIVFRRGDAETVKAICHEEIARDIPRFKSMQLRLCPIENWTTKLVWKYQGNMINMTTKKLAGMLKEQTELKSWRVDFIEETKPMCFAFTKQQLCEFFVKLDAEHKTRPTTAQVFGDTGETVDEAMKWYERVILGNHGAGKKRKDRGF